MDNKVIKKLFEDTRQRSLELIKNLRPEDTCIQSMEDASPIKWHLAHTSWFFEEFVIKKVKSNFKSPDPRFSYLFNSYYVQAGPRFTRSQRGLISKPDLTEVLNYRKLVNEILIELIEDQNTPLDIIELDIDLASGFLVMSSKELANRMTEQSNLMIDTLTSASFNEGGRIKELISQMRARRDQSIRFRTPPNPKNPKNQIKYMVLCKSLFLLGRPKLLP